MASTSSFPTPKFITGGCLCGSLRYRVDFPVDHDFKASASTCQCTQCRKQTSSLFLVAHKVSPPAAFQFTGDTSTLKNYSATPDVQRGFCSDCGSLVYWKAKDAAHTWFTVGTVDPLFLFGQGADAVQTGGQDKPVPKNGFGMALASGDGEHKWCTNEIPGVTDNIPCAGFGRGKRFSND
ncbi:Mss4-like protein [Podospora appendiculata]|uniref:Mss4-like protein n=1 Tax=Podospora appendiculata TaxID=314037 RepID=A0AAE0X985_9PEZI|nr:Mss4-like protein [Podospora appendiculata]